MLEYINLKHESKATLLPHQVDKGEYVIVYNTLALLGISLRPTVARIMAKIQCMHECITATIQFLQRYKNKVTKYLLLHAYTVDTPYRCTIH